MKENKKCCILNYPVPTPLYTVQLAVSKTPSPLTNTLASTTLLLILLLLALIYIHPLLDHDRESRRLVHPDIAVAHQEQVQIVAPGGRHGVLQFEIELTANRD